MWITYKMLISSVTQNLQLLEFLVACQYHKRMCVMQLSVTQQADSKRIIAIDLDAFIFIEFNLNCGYDVDGV